MTNCRFIMYHVTCGRCHVVTLVQSYRSDCSVFLCHASNSQLIHLLAQNKLLLWPEHKYVFKQVGQSIDSLKVIVQKSASRFQSSMSSSLQHSGEYILRNCILCWLETYDAVGTRIRSGPQFSPLEMQWNKVGTRPGTAADPEGSTEGHKSIISNDFL